MTVPNFTRVTQLHELLLSKKASRYMKWFDNDNKMELLFLVYLNQGDQTWGINDYINAVSSSPQSNSSMSVFLRHLTDQKILLMQDTDKRTRKHLIFSKQLTKEFESYMCMQSNIIDAMARKKSKMINPYNPYQRSGLG